MTDPKIIKAPWTDAQVENLNKWQNAGHVHPYTCGNNSRHSNLKPTKDGWVCLDCDYKQDWFPEYMNDEPPPTWYK